MALNRSRRKFSSKQLSRKNISIRESAINGRLAEQIINF